MMRIRAGRSRCCTVQASARRDWDHMGYVLLRSPHVNTPVSLQDARDAVDCCSGILNDQMKASCYNQFGVDGKMAEKYLGEIERMERQYMSQSNTHIPPFPRNKKNKKKWFGFGNDE